MNQAEVICRNSPSYWERSFALEMAARCTKICGLQFRVYWCRCCTKYHLTAKSEKTKA